MQTLKDGLQLCCLSQTFLPGVPFLLSLAPFWQRTCVHGAAVARPSPRECCFGEELPSLPRELELPGLMLIQVPSCGEEKAPALGGGLQKGPLWAEQLAKGLLLPSGCTLSLSWYQSG